MKYPGEETNNEKYLNHSLLMIYMVKLKDAEIEKILRKPKVKAFIHSPEFEDYVEELMQKLAPNGVLERWGPSTECLELPIFHDYISGKLTREERIKAEQHMANCGVCHDALEELVEVKEMMGTLPRDFYIRQAAYATQKFAHNVVDFFRQKMRGQDSYRGNSQ